CIDGASPPIHTATFSNFLCSDNRHINSSSIIKIFAIIVIATLSGVGICSAQFTAPAQTKAASKISLHPPAPGSVFRIKHWWTRGDGPPIGPHLATDSVIERGDYFMGKH